MIYHAGETVTFSNVSEQPVTYRGIVYAPGDILTLTLAHAWDDYYDAGYVGPWAHNGGGYGNGCLDWLQMAMPLVYHVMVNHATPERTWDTLRKIDPDLDYTLIETDADYAVYAVKVSTSLVENVLDHNPHVIAYSVI
jgi:hypothetical protein